MRKLALSDDILLSVDKPARYIGGELNSRDKNLDDVDIRFVMCFPDVYADYIRYVKQERRYIL